MILSVATALALMAGCTGGGVGGDTASAGEVNVYNWGEYIDESIFADFTAQT